MKPDIIVVHPRDVFYPLWIAQMNRDRELFGRIIIMMSPGSTDRDYTLDLRPYLEGELIIKRYHDDGKDWRNSAVNEALIHVQEEAVLFLEQDFMASHNFFKELLRLGEGYDAVGFREGEGRFHPACLLVKTNAINKTKKDFSVEPDISDHFAKFTKELEENGSVLDFQKLSMPKYHHLAGLTQNYRLTENFFKPEEFLTYLFCCLLLEQPNEWARFSIDKIGEVRISSDATGTDKLISSFFDDNEL